MPDTFTFGTYNLEYGGIDKGDDTRLRRQLAMLAEAPADAWALQECSHWAGNGALYLAEDILEMRGFIARSARGHGGDLAVFVRETTEIKVIETRHEEKPPYWHGVALITAEATDFGPIRLASAHLAPAAPSLRVIEAESFALIAEKPAPLIAGGDWNAVPLNAPAPDTGGIHPAKARRKLDSRAAAALSEYMTDTGTKLGDATPTVGHRRSDRLAYRADRIYTTLPDFAIISHQVIFEDDPQSDHRPVLATFNLGL